jgi:hypothetical protein
MGHKMQGEVERTYDHHDYLAEKGRALDKLAAELRNIVTPPPDNVRRLRPAAT